MLWPNESLWSVRRSMRCLSSSVRWLGSCQSRLCHRNEVLYHLELGIRYSSRSLSSWLVPTKLHPTLRIFLLIFRQKNIWPAGRNIYIRQLLYNQREWSVSSVGECRVSLCICDGLRWQWVQCRSLPGTLGDTGGTMPADTCWVLTRDNWLTRSYFLSSWQFALTWSEHSN